MNMLAKLEELILNTPLEVLQEEWASLDSMVYEYGVDPEFISPRWSTHYQERYYVDKLKTKKNSKKQPSNKSKVFFCLKLQYDKYI